MRWGASLAVIALGGLLLLGPIQNVVVNHETFGTIDVLFALVFIFAGVSFIVAGVIDWSSYIRVDDTSIFFGHVLTHRRCDRQGIARITVNTVWASRSTQFIRSDGSVALTTSGLLWGRARLKSLADYLGVPLAW
jgi:hypothetical protein